MKTYAAYYDNEIRIASSSGGLFSLIASKFDVVYGVAMTVDCYSAEFRRIDDGNITPLRGSKYFQAKVVDAFKQVKKDLNDGKRVLFTGTGCQINGLKCFLQKEFDNLTTVDVVCHGVPSPKLWKKYAEHQEAKYGKLESIDFRCKDDSWKDFGMKENKIFIPKQEDSFMRMFLRDYCLRPSCYECHAKNLKVSDMTIADFWGIENVAPEMNDGKGTSLIITRTDKGQALFDSSKQQLKWKEVSYDDGVKANPAEFRSPKRPEQRDTFFEDLDNLPFMEMENKYASGIVVPLWKRVGRKIKCSIKQMFRWGGGGDSGKK